MQFGTNHLAHLYLFQFLGKLLLAGTKGLPDFASRVVNLGSSGYRLNPVHLDNINLKGEGKYPPWVAYANSKRANIWVANQIERLYGTQVVHGCSLHSGGIKTALQKHVRAIMNEAKKHKPVMDHMKLTEQGAATSIWVATARELVTKAGVYCDNRTVPDPVSEVIAGDTRLASGYKAWAYDPEGEEKLWSVSLKMCGLDGEE